MRFSTYRDDCHRFRWLDHRCCRSHIDSWWILKWIIIIIKQWSVIFDDLLGLGHGHDAKRELWMSMQRTNERNRRRTRRERKKKLSNHRCARIHSSVLDLARVANLQSRRVRGMRVSCTNTGMNIRGARAHTHTHLYRQTLFETQEKEKRVEEINCRRRRKELAREQDAATIATSKRKW